MNPSVERERPIDMAVKEKQGSDAVANEKILSMSTTIEFFRWNSPQI